MQFASFSYIYYYVSLFNRLISASSCLYFLLQRMLFFLAKIMIILFSRYGGVVGVGKRTKTHITNKIKII